MYNCIKCKKPLPDEAVYCLFCGKKQKVTQRKRARSRKGQGSVCFHKASGSYYARITQNGVRVNVGYFPNETQAWAAVDKALQEHAGANYNWTVQRCYEEWSKVHYPTLSDSTQAGYQNAWRYMSRIYSMKMRDIKTSHLQSCIDYARECFALSVCEKIKSLSSQLCKYAMREDILNKNYAQFLELPQKQEEETTPFSEEEVQLLFDHDSLPDAKIILMLIYTGLRPNELFGLERKNIDLENRFIRGGIKTPAGRNRVVPISKKILPYFNYFYYRPKSLDQVYLIANEFGRKIDLNNWRKRGFYPTLEKVGIDNPDLVPYSCRHTFATMCDKNDIQDTLMIKMIGHTKKQTTEKFYIHKTEKDMREAVDKL